MRLKLGCSATVNKIRGGVGASECKGDWNDERHGRRRRRGPFFFLYVRMYIHGYMETYNDETEFTTHVHAHRDVPRVQDS